MRIVFIAVALLVFAGLSRAATPAEYRTRLENARAMVDDAIANGGASAERLSVIKQQLPADMEIEMAGGTRITADNSWLAAELSRYSSETDAAKRRAGLIAISERLTGLSASVAELINAESGSATKDSNKRALAEILRRPEYQKPEKPQASIAEKWIDKILEWLRGVFPSAPSSPSSPSGLGQMKLGLQILVFVLVAALVAFLVYKFAPAIIGRVRSRERSPRRQDRVVLGELIDAHESGEDLFTEAEMLARRGELRAAIRKGYIAALVELGDRNAVRLARHKTNRDYLRELRRRERLYENMNVLTGSFERSWYGLRPAGDADWDEFVTRYRDAIREAAKRG